MPDLLKKADAIWAISLDGRRGARLYSLESPRLLSGETLDVVVDHVDAAKLELLIALIRHTKGRLPAAARKEIERFLK